MTERPGSRRALQHPRKRRLDHWRLVSPSGATVISLRQLPLRERLRVISPSLFTTANIFCGFSSVLLAFRGQFTWAAVLIAVAIVMDICDGAVARLVGATSPVGIQLDSLADLISFGVAPAVLVHTWALPQWPVLAWAAAFFWLACAAFRLARFNVTVDPMDDKRYFVGLPSPAAAAVIMATIFAMDRPRVGPDFVAPIAIGVIPAVLMVTSIRFRSFRNLLTPRTARARLGTLGVLGAIIAGLFVVPGLTGVIIAYGYVLTAPLGVLLAPLRRRLLGVESIPPQRQRARSVFLPEPAAPSRSDDSPR
jgi:CDP-diacylglycerol--serine O-phosphatidyltransferase